MAVRIPLPPFGAFGVSQQMRSPYIQNFHFDVQRELTHSMLLQVGYVGNQARKLPINLEINQPLPDPSGNLTTQERRPYNSQFPDIAGITELRTAGTSHYNSMQISLRNNLWHGLTGQIQYTLSHAPGRYVQRSEQRAGRQLQSRTRLGQRRFRCPPCRHRLPAVRYSELRQPCRVWAAAGS